MVDRPTWKAFFLFFCSLDLTCTADWGGGGMAGDGPALLDRLLASPAFPMLSPYPSILE